MIDLPTGRFEIIQYKDKQEATIANIVEQTWLCRYPRPAISTYDRGNKLLCRAFNKYSVKNKYIINPSV